MTFKQVAIGLFAVLIILQLLSFYNQHLSPSGIVYVDSNKLLENYPGMRAARKAFQQKAIQWQANIDTLKSELNKEIRSYEQGKKSLSAKERSLSEELIKTKRQQFLDYQNGIQQKSQQEDYQMTEQVLTEINTFIKEYGKRKGYRIILGTNNSGSIVYAKDALNITEELQEALNTQYQGL
ncbi:MAG: OmpH family outer membrane protein [Bacteroidota bacterium]